MTRLWLYCENDIEPQVERFYCGPRTQRTVLLSLFFAKKKLFFATA